MSGRAAQGMQRIDIDSRVIQSVATGLDLVLQAGNGRPQQRHGAGNMRRGHGRAAGKGITIVAVLQAERVLVPGAVMSGFVRLLPSLVTGPRLLKLAIVSVPVFNAPTV